MIKRLKHYSVPHLLHIEMSYACNSKCLFCYNPHRKSPIDYFKIDKIVESVYSSHIPHVYLIGGEPSLLKTQKLNQYIDLLSKRSSVTIVTNGLIYKKNLSRKLSCIGIPIHGNKKIHEMLTNNKGGYQKTIKTIKNYIKDGFDVRCIPVLMSINYNQIYEIIKLAKELGMESVFVDRFESGGIGSKVADKLKISSSQFKEALDQMIKARNDFNIPVGFGTAIPFCVDERLIRENMWADCGVGVTFCAINPSGDLRICNQSNISYGNILKDSVEKIWNRKKIDDFRDLRWVKSPCKKCPLLHYCTCGCKVDLTCSNEYCIDYAVRENKSKLLDQNKMKDLSKIFLNNKNTLTITPKKYRKFTLNRYAKLNFIHKENYLVTRYQTVVLDKVAMKIIKEIFDGISSEKDLIKKFENQVDKKELRFLVNKLIDLECIDLK
ncbi:MAG: hypothetical protein PWQ56_423 [Patescibacteria group bacterium]|nr:hypothetical protein [Patescibacteria group bacterium]